MTRALLLDLDDTLYRERRFLASGYAAVARWIAARTGHPERAVFVQLVAAARAGRRGTAFQSVCERFDLDPAMLPDLLEVYRAHRPRLRLPRSSRRMLERVRGSWKTALVTNGPADLQRRKVAALDLDRMVDAVVFASECGSGTGKPEPAPFEHALALLGAKPEQAVMVGDNPICDIDGARAVGLATIRVRRDAEWQTPMPGAPDADAVIASMDEVPEMAERLVEERVIHAD